MANNFQILGTLAALCWALVNGPPPSTEPEGRSSGARVAAAVSSKVEYLANGSVVEARQPPVPLVRNFRPRAEAPPLASAVDTQQQAQDALDRKAAKAAVEADGYKRVTILSKASNGAWRAKGYRGTTEVQLTVDGTGQVTMD